MQQSHRARDLLRIMYTLHPARILILIIARSETIPRKIMGDEDPDYRTRRSLERVSFSLASPRARCSNPGVLSARAKSETFRTPGGFAV
jgi:hypothetical protein